MATESVMGVGKIYFKAGKALAVGGLFKQSPGAIGAFEQFFKSAETKKHSDLGMKRPSEFDRLIQRFQQ